MNHFACLNLRPGIVVGGFLALAASMLPTAAIAQSEAFDRFSSEKVQTNGIALHVRRDGEGPAIPVALLFAADFPDRALSLGYVDEPLIGYNDWPMTAFSEENHGGYWQFGLNWTPGLPEILYSGNEEAFLAFIFDAMTVSDGVMTDADVAAHARGMKRENGIDGSVGWYRAVGQTGAQVREVVEAGSLRDTPVLAIAGEAGITIVPEQMKQVSDRVTGHVIAGSGHVIAGSGHLVAEERPDVMAEAMIAFFEDVAR